MADFAGQTVLVTGASGFIGSCLCRRLGQLGAEVHAVSRIERSSMDTSVARWWTGDMADRETAARIVQTLRPAFIFHLASLVSGSRSLESVLPMLHGNLVTTVNLLVAAAGVACERIVLAGSLEEPDAGAEAIPVSPYAAAKGASTAYARMFHALYGTPVVVARLFMVYGPEQRDLTKLIPYVTLSLLQDRPPRINSGARPVDWIYVCDVVEGLLACGQGPTVPGSSVDIGTGQLVTVRQVVERLSGLIGSAAQPEFDEHSDLAIERVRKADADDALTRLNWSAKTALDDGLRQTVDWYAARLKSGGLDLTSLAR